MTTTTSIECVLCPECNMYYAASCESCGVCDASEELTMALVRAKLAEADTKKLLGLLARAKVAVEYMGPTMDDFEATLKAIEMALVGVPLQEREKLVQQQMSDLGDWQLKYRESQKEVVQYRTALDNVTSWFHIYYPDASAEFVLSTKLSTKRQESPPVVQVVQVEPSNNERTPEDEPVPAKEWKSVEPPSEAAKIAAFQKGLEHLINSMSMEGIFGDIPDYMLAGHATEALLLLAKTTKQNLRWHGFKPFSSSVMAPPDGPSKVQ